jgi:hypothetical protein
VATIEEAAEGLGESNNFLFPSPGSGIYPSHRPKPVFMGFFAIFEASHAGRLGRIENWVWPRVYRGWDAGTEKFFRVVLPPRLLFRGCRSITNHHKVNRLGRTDPVSVLFS